MLLLYVCYQLCQSRLDKFRIILGSHIFCVELYSYCAVREILLYVSHVNMDTSPQCDTTLKKSTRRYQQVIITVILNMDGDVRFKALFAESLIMQSKKTISGLTCLVRCS
jgi:hypothetical protein